MLVSLVLGHLTFSHLKSELDLTQNDFGVPSSRSSTDLNVQVSLGKAIRGILSVAVRVEIMIPAAVSYCVCLQ